MPNRLAQETSPYLLQHKDNPVDWHPWGEEALARAREEDRPILLSIGYSACHWCHVMERESFEDEATAAYMNEHFVCVKLDREERPDLDAIYMEACMAMTGHGGWPLNVFLTPEHVPFYAGTYFPPAERGGMPSWLRVLSAVTDAWDTKRDEIRAGGDRIARRLQGGALLTPSDEEIDPAGLDAAVDALRQAFDPNHGGFGGAPKFPPSSAIEFLLRRDEVGMTSATLRAMASGGMYDQVGGGFARYSVDDRWLVPHFEKMLYDNALLARAYLHGWQVTGDELFRRVAVETLDWALREMRGPEGGFLSALDADSEGVEGKFYVWSVDELRDALGQADGDAAIEYFGASTGGNFEGSNILTRGDAEPPQLESIRSRLYSVRSERVWPGIDDKRIASWNALMISALADAGAVLERQDYLDAACECAAFVLGSMRGPDGRLLRTYKDGAAKLNGYLEDHAYLVEALISLYEATFDARWFVEARSVADFTIAHFADDAERGGFFETADYHERLVARRKDLEDNPIPAGNSSLAYGLLRLALLTGEYAYEERAVGVFRLLHKIAFQHPQAFAHLLQAMDFWLAPVKEVALVGPDVEPLERVVRRRFRPHLVLAGEPSSSPSASPDGSAVVPLLVGRGPVDGRAAAYVCERFACKQPVTQPDELAALLD
jgi:uncharacterized protein YyaL (SSP411 family)